MVIEIQTRPNAGIPFGFADGIFLLDLEFTSSAVIKWCADPLACQSLNRNRTCRAAEHDHIWSSWSNNQTTTWIRTNNQDDDYDWLWVRQLVRPKITVWCFIRRRLRAGLGLRLCHFCHSDRHHAFHSGDLVERRQMPCSNWQWQADTGLKKKKTCGWSCLTCFNLGCWPSARRICLPKSALEQNRRQCDLLNRHEKQWRAINAALNSWKKVWCYFPVSCSITGLGIEPNTHVPQIFSAQFLHAEGLEFGGHRTSCRFGFFSLTSFPLIIFHASIGFQLGHPNSNERPHGTCGCV